MRCSSWPAARRNPIRQLFPSASPLTNAGHSLKWLLRKSQLHRHRPCRNTSLRLWHSIVHIPTSTIGVPWQGHRVDGVGSPRWPHHLHGRCTGTFDEDNTRALYSLHSVIRIILILLGQHFSRTHHIFCHRQQSVGCRYLWRVWSDIHSTGGSSSCLHWRIGKLQNAAQSTSYGCVDWHLSPIHQDKKCTSTKRSCLCGSVRKRLKEQGTQGAGARLKHIISRQRWQLISQENSSPRDRDHIDLFSWVPHHCLVV